VAKRKIPIPPKEEISVKQATCYVLRAGFLLGLLFNPEEGGDMFLRKVGLLHRTTRRYVLEYRILHNHSCENLRTYMSNLIARNNLR
jgi:hypothetical protein